MGAERAPPATRSLEMTSIWKQAGFRRARMERAPEPCPLRRREPIEDA